MHRIFRYLISSLLLCLVPVAITAPAEAGEIMTVRHLPGGIHQISIYFAAPGAPQLASRVAARSSFAASYRRVPRFPNSCSYDTARTLFCPIATWPNNGRPNPSIVFVDDTSAQWDVSGAVAGFQSAVHELDTHYIRGSTCTVEPGQHCIRVTSGDYGPTGWGGIAHITAQGSRLLSARIELNDYPGYPLWGKQPRGIACHEGGHTLGLGHSEANAESCMSDSAQFDTLGVHASKLLNWNYYPSR